MTLSRRKSMDFFFLVCFFFVFCSCCNNVILVSSFILPAGHAAAGHAAAGHTATTSTTLHVTTTTKDTTKAYSGFANAVRNNIVGKASRNSATATARQPKAKAKARQPKATKATTQQEQEPTDAEKFERIISNCVEGQDDQESMISSLEDHWWPVTTEVALDKDSPNAVQVLGQPLVLFYDASDNTNSSNHEWKCLQDMCSHRFAPLSQGTLITTQRTTANPETNKGTTTTDCRLVCRNHEWEFDAAGTCLKSAPAVSPNDGEDDAIPGVSSYPVQVAAGMVWVYMGDDYDDATTPTTTPTTTTTTESLPISPLLQKWYDQFGDDACFMRDLPVGMELVAEQFLDLSRLPFSLHSIGGLDRSQATPIQMELIDIQAQRQREQRQLPKMLVTSKQKATNTNTQKTSKTTTQTTGPFPLFQATVLNAATTDPVYRSMKTEIPKNATVTLSYYAPNHIRIHRDRNGGGAGHWSSSSSSSTSSSTSSGSSATEVFLCPIARGKTRVFFFQTFENALFHKDDDDAQLPPQTYSFVPPVAIPKKSIPRQLLEWCLPALQRNVLHPTSAKHHMFVHDLFDGDGAMLQQRQNRNQHQHQQQRGHHQGSNYDAAGGTADVMVHAVARYLEKAVAMTIQRDDRKDGIAKSVLMTSSEDVDRATYFGGQTPILLDRQSHTNNCRVCQAALQERQERYDTLQTAQSALIGAAGASTCLAIMSMAVASITRNRMVVRVVAASALTAVVAALGVNQWKQRTFAKLQAFFFQEYKNNNNGGGGNGSGPFGAKKFTRP